MKKEIKVTDLRAPKFEIAEIANDMRELSAKDYRLVKRLSRAQRRIDRKYKKLQDDKDTCGRLVMLNSPKVYRKALSLAKTLRHADEELAKAQSEENKANNKIAAAARMELA